MEVISCHSEDEIRRISISWTTSAKPCDSSLRSERQVLCHTALDAVSHKYSAFTSSPCDRGSESAMTISILPLEIGATHVENLQAGRGSSLRRDFVMLNLFQHLTSLACSLFINKILKQVQDDTIRNFCNELFNHSTLQLFNSRESSPHPSPLLEERQASRVRKFFAKRIKFFEAKSVDSFNASDSRQSRQA